MRQSQLFTRTRREAPKDEVSKNAELLIRAGFIHKEMAGVYSMLPLGLRTLNKIVNVIREEMNSIGGQEVYLSALQDKKNWEATNRWSDEVLDVWFKTSLKNGTELGLGTTHEEAITSLMKDHIRSFRDLPVYAYQFQTKFRNEARAKSGIMRCREFLMKDLYSFCRNTEEQNAYYEKAKAAYIRIYDRLGIGNETYVTFSSGGTFSKYSHEFQALTEAGEDTIYVYEGKGDKVKGKNAPTKFAVNKEVLNDEVLKDLGVKREDLVERKAVEVGNIFNLGTRFSEALGLVYKNEEGKTQPVVMGCYGIGPGRVMGTIVEIHADEKGLVWPDSVAPFAVHLVALFDKNGKVKEAADKIYADLIKKGVEVLFDDRDASAGEKFSDSDLIGIPERWVVSEKTLANNSIEIKDRKTGKVAMKVIG